jgi:hypothetical protein
MAFRWLIVGLLAIAPACSTKDAASAGTSGNAAAGSAAVGSGGEAGAAVVAEPRVCEQACRDYLVSFGLLDTLLGLYAANIEGNPPGPLNTVADCPLSGSTLITGSVEITDAGLAAANVSFSLRDCESSDVPYHLTFDGRVSLQGAFGGVGATTLSFASDALTVSGTLMFRDNPAVDETAALSATQQVTDGGEILSGQVGGRAFSSETAYSLGGAGSAGAPTQ